MRIIILSIISTFLYINSMSAQGSDTKQNGLVVKLSATWCPVCSGAAWNSYNSLLNNVKNNAFYFTAHSSSTSRLFSQTGSDIIRNFDQSAYQPAFYLNGLNKGSGGSVTEREIKNTIEDDVTKEPSALMKTVAKATGNTSIKAQVTLTFPKLMTGNYTIGLYLVEKVVKEIQAGLDKAKNDAQNSNLQKFLNNLESRIYAQISQNLATAMFANGGSSSGTLNFEGNTMFWTKDSSNVYLTVTDTIGTQTSITIPLGQFQF